MSDDQPEKMESNVEATPSDSVQDVSASDSTPLEVEQLSEAASGLTASSDENSNDAEVTATPAPVSASGRALTTSGAELVGEVLVAGLEALLFASTDPISLDRLIGITGASEQEVADALVILGNRYAEQTSGLVLTKVAGGYQVRSDSEFASIIRVLKEAKPRRLSNAALETLAIVAYRQPIVKSDVDAIRGVDVAPTLKTLLERGLVRILGHQPTVGQPALYGTTEEFLKLFGINAITELPTLRDVQEMDREPGEAEDDSPEVSASSSENEPANPSSSVEASS